jgi:hypothetical protein
MNPINSYINQINRSGGISSFGSVEDLIKTSLGGSFIDSIPKQEEPPQREEPFHSHEEEDEEIERTIQDSIQRLKNFDPSQYKKKVSPTPRDYTERIKRDPIDIRDEEEIEEIPILKKQKQEASSKKISNYYPFYRDVEEVFECKVTIEGTASNSIVRLLLETETWDVIFQGKIKKDGICSIPIKKLSLFPVGTIGKATLEVIVDDILFTPWENPFRIEESKKVEVEVFKRRTK